MPKVEMDTFLSICYPELDNIAPRSPVFKTYVLCKFVNNIFSPKWDSIFLKSLVKKVGANPSEQFKIRIIVINLGLKTGFVRREDDCVEP